VPLTTTRARAPFPALTTVLILFAALLAAVALPRPAAALPDGLAPTPPMGFNNWNSTHCGSDFDEAMVESIADIFVSSGLKDAGYRYVNLDDCWATPGVRDAQGNLVPDPTRFPHGIKAVADYVHARGLKIGIYTSAGTKTCNSAGFPGGQGHEAQDAALFASWGIDYLKYDNCNPLPGTADTQQEYIDRYTTMRDALRATGRPIVYSLCEWGRFEPWTWGADVGHLWRTTGDISDSFSSMVNILRQNAPLDAYAGPGHWNDPDMLEVGNGGMTDTEYRSHFSLWSIMAAPLLIGTDLRKATPETMRILGNREVIAVDQDPLGKQGHLLSNDGGLWTFAKPLANGDVAVALFNQNSTGARISTSAGAVGLPDADTYLLRDLWSHETTETAGTISASVPAHATVMYRVSAGGNPSGYPPNVSMGLTGLPDAVVQGGDATATVSFTDDGVLPAQDVDLRLHAPDGWTVTPTSPTTFGSVESGRTVEATYRVGIPDPTKTETAAVTASAGYRWHGTNPASTSASRNVLLSVPAGSFAALYDNVGVSDDTDTDAANLDGAGSSLSAQALAAAGVTPGAAVSHAGLGFTWPDVPAGQPDNVVAGGQSFRLSGSGGTLGFLAAGTYGTATGTGTIGYADGSTESFTLNVPDWYSNPPSDADAAITMAYRNRVGNVQQSHAVHVFYAGVPLRQGKAVSYVVLPNVSGAPESGVTAMHVFAVAIG
jgi:alpha-galactosidase